MKTLQESNNADSAFQDALSNPVALAVAVLVDRIKALPKDDRDDLFELTGVLLSAESDEERKSAADAMREILQQDAGVASKMEIPGKPSKSVEGWLEWISSRIRESRKSAGLTQEQLAEKCGLTQSHISRLEAKQHSPSFRTIEKLATALGLPPAHFDPSA